MRKSTFRLALAAAGLLAAGCSRPAPDSAGAQAGSPPQASYYTVPPAQLSHVQVVPVAKTTWAISLAATGTVDWDNDHTTQVITQVGGPITRLAVDTGAHVKKGDPLLYVASPDVTNAISAYRKAKNRVDLAQRTIDRDKDLLEHKAIAQRDMDAAQADYNDASTDVQTALQALKIFGVTQADLNEEEQQNVAIQPELPLRAPIDGTVVQRLVLPGQVIQAATTLAFVISDVSTVWVQGHVYEQDLARVHDGDKVDISNPAFPTTFHGTVTHIDDLVDPTTRTTLVRVVTANPGAQLKKDLFVNLVVHDRTQHDVLAVPAAAVLYDEQNFPFVYLEVSSGKFAQRQVTLGAQQAGQVEVTGGLKDGDRVVAEGSLFLQFANSQ